MRLCPVGWRDMARNRGVTWDRTDSGMDRHGSEQSCSIGTEQTVGWTDMVVNRVVPLGQNRQWDGQTW